MKKRIGISYSEASFQNYLSWFTPDDLGDDVELVELSFERDNLPDIYTCDGFVLTGGVDVQPSLYGGEEIYPNQSKQMIPERDHFEKKVWEYSQLQKLPLLGICRGLQLVNVLQGGTLVQDLGEKNATHKKETDKDKKHRIKAKPSTFLYELVHEEAGEVNSAHHQAIDQLGENLMVNTLSAEDGMIEGIEFAQKEGKSFMLCVQWHPERMENKEENVFSQKIKSQFLTEVRKSAMKKLTVVNPATEEVITSLNEDSEVSVTEKMNKLREGQVSWQKVPLPERVAILQNFAALLLEHVEDLAPVLTAEVGKPLQQSRNEINGAVTRIQWLTKNAEKYLSDELMTDEEGLQERIVYEPLGVVCNISAWNYPYLVGVNVFVPALLAGNAVMYKPSELATLTGLQIERFLKKAGVPDPVFQVAVGAKDVGEMLLDLPFDGYFFTGSYKTGKYIYERVAPKMVPCQCELGGKDPLYVADDVADVKAVAAATADGAFYNNGQSCCAVERIYVHEAIYEKYMDAFTREVALFKAGLPTEDGVYIGPVTRKEQIHFLAGQIREAVEKGATVAAGGHQVNRKGYYFQPTVLTNVSHDMRIMKEESFGPVIGIMKVSSDEEAVRLMQDTKYGLTASVYSCSKERAQTILGQMNTGTVYWNCCDRVSAALPWSGRKNSGFGATLSSAGLRAFTKPKAFHLRGI